jgi:regulator of sirC expression with transglutaminase-like and TPR domain
MRAARLLLVPLTLSLALTTRLRAADEDKKPATEAPPVPKAVEKLAETAKKSLVVVTFSGRDGKRQGLGTGFVVAADGLIATNLHVLGDARPIQVKLADGKSFDVTSVHASDRTLDLALIRIDAKDLTPLPLGDSDALKQGQAVAALGNPHGLTFSVVSGVVSGRREIEGRNMIQLAMPIEPGNSGGPLLDMDGKVHGIITMKSLVTNNLGFAVPANSLKTLLKKPNPIPMSRWLTIGALDSEEWIQVFGARWRQRAGKIQVEGAGAGFGGRALCLKKAAPEVPYEVTTTVRLDAEEGAAGLVFQADGKDRHYGFYPSGGKLRLTRFDGPDVFSWKILANEGSDAYKPGEWNVLKVRVEKEKLICYVNSKKVFEVEESDLPTGKVGLAKFRDTRAEFKQFKVGKSIADSDVPAPLADKVKKAVADIAPSGPFKPGVVDSLAPDAPASLTALRERAKLLEQQAAQIRSLAVAVHQKRVLQDMAKLLEAKEADFDLAHAVLLLAALDNDEVDIEPYRKEIDRMARDIKASLPKDASEKIKLEALNKYLFTERGFHGARTDYYNKSNSYLNEVIDDREGLPITLAVLHMEVGRRVGLKVEGVPLPGHFMVRWLPAKGEGQLIDVYDGGKLVSREEAGKRVLATTGEPMEERHLKPAAKKMILTRMLHNLMNVARNEKDIKGMLRYLDGILTVTPDAAEERWLRAIGRFNVGDREGVKEDTGWLLDKQPEGIPLERVRELRRLAEQGGE